MKMSVYGSIGHLKNQRDPILYLWKSEIESIIKQINPDYIISYEPTPHHPEEILVAKIP